MGHFSEEVVVSWVTAFLEKGVPMIALDLNPGVHRTFALMVNSCRLLFDDSLRQEGVTVKLSDWNNNHGVEFEILQSVFPVKIPKVIVGQGEIQLPVATFSSFNSLIHFASVALQVDAYFSMYNSFGDELFVHDARIEINTEKDVAQYPWLTEYC